MKFFCSNIRKNTSISVNLIRITYLNFIEKIELKNGSCSPVIGKKYPIKKIQIKIKFESSNIFFLIFGKKYNDPNVINVIKINENINKLIFVKSSWRL